LEWCDSHKVMGWCMDDICPFLLTRTELEGKPVSYHRSRVNSVTWRTCHDKMMARGGLFEQLELGLYTEVEHAHG
jgi:hypothetical protein